uniref:Uncharacterized protein n=1 Tax=virus sp. ctviY17 TaxID=2825828 RepID=A0A8S5RLR7_9VIRU|nr:MAG TPA: hypothetical protein [virus sp. ctviY17]
MSFYTTITFLFRYNLANDPLNYIFVETFMS